MKTKKPATQAKVDQVTKLLADVSQENGDLYDGLGIIAQDILEAKEGKPGQIQDLLSTIDEFKLQVKKEFDIAEPSIWDEWLLAKKDDKPYDIEKVVKELKGFMYNKSAVKALEVAVELSKYFDADFNKTPALKDMFDYLAIVIVESIDNFYTYGKNEQVENLEEMQRVLREYQRFIASLYQVTKGPQK